ncbi:hypothetical protein [Methanosarcina barkeri]|uniref:hypothetical protein n=1 Tax=Methanosarcina barkeri TaxID=2208 RepID=UPI000ADF2765|nr:hypothetical protein [Methanosarcina barkeri]
MRKRNLLLIPIFLILLVMGLFVHGIYMNEVDWRNDGQRYQCLYSVKVTGLSGREVQGMTVIMVPIPASKEGRFFTPPAQKDPYFTQKLIHKTFNWSEQYHKGPYFRNMTEIFDNKEIDSGNWITFIAETEKGHMLGFKTNKTRLKDIDYITSFVADNFDVFDPINNGSPMIFPVENVSNVSSVPYGKYTKYASYPTYDTYVYLSDNLKEEENILFFVYLNANNDPTEWPREYFGWYNNLLAAKVNDTGYVKVKAILGQKLGENDSLDVLGSQYAFDYYENKTSHVINETTTTQMHEIALGT